MKRREFLATSAGVAGTFLPFIGRAQSKPCPPPELSVSGGTSAAASCLAGDAEADWIARTTGTGVVWYHDFRSVHEVNNFRWTSGYGTDPNSVGENPTKCRHISSDGITGGCLEIVHPPGADPASGYWWRPFSPIVAGSTTGNGRATSDPGAGGSLTAQAWNPQDRSQTASWSSSQYRQNQSKGVYGHASYAGPGYDGTDFYIQLRLKTDPRRWAEGNSGQGVGKILFLTLTSNSNTTQEIVTNQSSKFNMYSHVKGLSVPMGEQVNGSGAYGAQVNSQYGTCNLKNNPSGCWGHSGYARFSNGWDTILYHITPGRAGLLESRIEVYVASPGQTKYTKIWDQVFQEDAYDYGDNGWNALLLTVYSNVYQGYPITQEFFHRFGQVIFSKQMIACPNDPVQRGEV